MKTDDVDVAAVLDELSEPLTDSLEGYLWCAWCDDLTDESWGDLCMACAVLARGHLRGTDHE